MFAWQNELRSIANSNWLLSLGSSLSFTLFVSCVFTTNAASASLSHTEKNEKCTRTNACKLRSWFFIHWSSMGIIFAKGYASRKNFPFLFYAKMNTVSCRWSFVCVVKFHLQSFTIESLVILLLMSLRNVVGLCVYEWERQLCSMKVGEWELGGRKWMRLKWKCHKWTRWHEVRLLLSVWVTLLLFSCQSVSFRSSIKTCLSLSSSAFQRLER